MVNGKAWFAEALSTFGLVFFGPLAVIVSVPMFGLGLAGMGLRKKINI